jgi:ribose transport system ATP-binding protein
MSALVAARNIRKAFDRIPVLHGIDLDLMPGEIIGLLGENGAGKSTLMNILAGELSADSGELAFDDAAIRLDGTRDRHLGIRFIHQELSIVPSLSVAENIFLGDYCAGPSGFIDRKAMRTRAAALLARVGASHIDPRISAGRLRAGEQQLVEVAKALAGEIRLLIMDEPTSSLTDHEAQALFGQMRSLAAAGVAVIFITHRIEEALSICNRILVLRDGRVVSDRPANAVDRATIIRDMVGREATFAYRGSGVIESEIALSVDGITDGKMLQPISFDLRKGEVLGLFGLVGSGRTELLELIYGARPASSGTMQRNGQSHHPLGPSQAVASGIFMVPEGRKTRGILPRHSVGRNVSIGSLRRLSPFGLVNRARERTEVLRQTERLRVRMTSPSQRITTLSGGNQQKALLGRALMLGPGVLLLDEPTQGVDVGAKSEIYDIIHDMTSHGLGLLAASSEIPEILAIADRCAVLSRGRLAGILSREEMNEAAILTLAFAGH